MQSIVCYVSFALVLALTACHGEFSSTGDPVKPGGLGTLDAGGTADGASDPDAAVKPDTDGATGSCGDGSVDPGETCDPCALGCDDGNVCTNDVVSGSAETCDLVCTNTPIDVCEDGDGCCPSGCDTSNDGDCSPTCGNEVVDENETCDPADTCTMTCDDGDACTNETMTGSAANCNVACSYTSITACVPDDGCCPVGCNANTDTDCTGVCGNDVVEAGESCDGDCPDACDDQEACTTDTLVGSAAGCTARCQYADISACTNGDRCCAPGCNATNDDDCAPVCGNGVIESGELCDGDCPTSCDDAMNCTADVMSGSAATCDATCTNTTITACAAGDGCCPPACNETNDADCAAVCGNDIIESGETCDGNCPASCDDADACTTDARSGTAATCNVACTNTAITTCTGGDGCCPSSCDATNDSDCAVDCRDDATWPSNWKSYETSVVTELNAVRAAGADCGVYGVYPPAGPLTMNAQLREASRCHSLDMGTNNFFSHTGSNGSSFTQRTTTAGFTGTPLGENIAAGYSTPAAVVAGWVSSDGHCRNLMNGSATLVGIGYVNVSGSQWGHYWTMVTGR